MRCYEMVVNGYIEYVGIGAGGTEISEEEYIEILDAIKRKPPATKTMDYRLREDLTWESYQIIIEPEQEYIDINNNL